MNCPKVGQYRFCTQYKVIEGNIREFCLGLTQEVRSLVEWFLVDTLISTPPPITQEGKSSHGQILWAMVRDDGNCSIRYWEGTRLGKVII